MEAIITAATVLASYLNVATANQSGYVYNASFEDNNVARIEVMNNTGGVLTNKLQQRFAYDNRGRLTSKETLRWNTETGEFQPSELYTYSYNNYGYSMSMRRWDKKSSSYAPSGDMTVYHMVGNKVMAVDTYKRNSQHAPFELTSGILVMNPDNSFAMM